MKTIAKLIKKEKLRSNYKLTFSNDRGELYPILHQNKGELFDTLKLDFDYSFSARKGKKKYYFINPQSIKAILSNSNRVKEVKDFYYNKIRQELGIKEFPQKSITDRLTELRTIAIKQKEDWGNKTFFLTWMKEAIYSLKVNFDNSTHNEELEKFFLDIQTLLFWDTYYKKD